MPNDKEEAFIIMCGGYGERFWPKSRQATPKQTLSIGTNKPLLIEAVERAAGLVDFSKIFISTGAELEMPFKSFLKDYNVNYIIEPMRRDTAAAIGYTSMILAEKLGRNAVVAFVGSDYVIPNKKDFQNHISAAFELARRDNVIVTLGINPSRPATGYGYIQKGEKLEDPIAGFEAFKVKAFKEKPNEDLAEDYLDSGDYFWNSGMFICKIGVILHELKEFTPKLFNALEKMAESKFEEKTVNELFEKLEKISIDFAVMEKTERIAVLKGNFDWDDMGDWEAYARATDKDALGNSIFGSHIGVKTKDCVIYNDTDTIVTTIGVSDLIIVQTKDALLICPKDQAQNVKKLVRKLEKGEETK